MDNYFCRMFENVKNYITNENLISRYSLLNEEYISIDIEDSGFLFRFKYNIDWNKYSLSIDSLFLMKNKIFSIPCDISLVTIYNCASLYEKYGEMGDNVVRYFSSFVDSNYKLYNELYFTIHNIESETCMDYISFITYSDKVVNEKSEWLFANRFPLLTINYIHIHNLNLYQMSILSLGIKYDYSYTNEFNIDVPMLFLDKNILKTINLVEHLNKIGLFISYKVVSYDKLTEQLSLFRSIIKTVYLIYNFRISLILNLCEKINVNDMVSFLKKYEKDGQIRVEFVLTNAKDEYVDYSVTILI